MLDFIETFIISAFYIIIFSNLVLYCIKTIDCSEWTIVQPFANTEEAVDIIEGDVKEVTSPDVMNDAVSGLVNMGFKKTEARVAVAGKVQNKVYTDPLELIKDAFARD
tara:strand:- start:1298 stop:1621 length:324 start_codon:yes stop_codon:yes gene_type:complete